MAKRSGQPESKGRARGRPRAHVEPTTKTSVVILNRQIAYLDKFAAEVRAVTGAVVDRGAIIRALIETMEAAAIEPSRISSEVDIRNQLTGRLRTR